MKTRFYRIECPEGYGPWQSVHHTTAMRREKLFVLELLEDTLTIGFYRICPAPFEDFGGITKSDDIFGAPTRALLIDWFTRCRSNVRALLDAMIATGYMVSVYEADTINVAFGSSGRQVKVSRDHITLVKRIAIKKVFSRLL